MAKNKICLCGSGEQFDNCCTHYIVEGKIASTAEILMRSRYSAYVRGEVNYLLKSWHSSTRPLRRELEKSIAEPMQWLSLDVVSITAGSVDDKKGRVEFIAHYKRNDHLEILHETSCFLQEQGRWYYLDGEIHSTENSVKKTSRNSLCYCNSGKKYKRCCGR